MNKSDTNWINGYIVGQESKEPDKAEQWLIRFMEKHQDKTDQEFTDWLEK
jgi:hypothetical protein